MLEDIFILIIEVEGFNELAKRLDTGIQPLIDNIEQPATLKALFYEAHKRQTQPGKPPRNARCSDTDSVVKVRTLNRLSAIGTPASTTVLIELYKDPELPFFGPEGMTLAKALSEGGEEVLKAIEAIAQQRPLIGPKVVNSIKTGQKLY